MSSKLLNKIQAPV